MRRRTCRVQSKNAIIYLEHLRLTHRSISPALKLKPSKEWSRSITSFKLHRDTAAMADSKRVRISKREGALMARLSAKEQEVYEVQCSARDLYRARRPVTDYARQVYTDPAINVEFQLMTAQLAEMENSLRLKDAELKELRASIDTGKGAEGKGKNGADTKAVDSGKPSNVGDGGEGKVARASALVARCQRLEQENEELASSADVAKVAQLTSEKAVAEAYAGELKTALEEAYEYIEQLEEEREVNSGKVYALEEQLRVVASQQYAQQEYSHLSLENDESHEMNDDEAIDDQSWDTRPNETLEDVHPNPKEEGDDEERTENNVQDRTPSPPQGAPDDMDDLYGDIGGDIFGDDAGSGGVESGKSTVPANKEGDPREVKEEGDGRTSLGPEMETETETTDDSKKLNAEEGQKEKAEEEEKDNEEVAVKDKAEEEGKDKEEAVKDNEEAEKDKEEAVKDNGEEEKEKEEAVKDKGQEEKDKEEGEHKAKKRRMGTRKSPRIRTRSTAA